MRNWLATAAVVLSRGMSANSVSAQQGAGAPVVPSPWLCRVHQPPEPHRRPRSGIGSQRGVMCLLTSPVPQMERPPRRECQLQTVTAVTADAPGRAELRGSILRCWPQRPVMAVPTSKWALSR
jgi:hypothetical protein